MEIIYNNEGTPLLIQSSSMFASTIADKASMEERRRVLFPYDDNHRDYTYVDGKRVVSWGTDNHFPYHAIRTVRDTTVLNTGLKFLAADAGTGHLPLHSGRLRRRRQRGAAPG